MLVKVIVIFNLNTFIDLIKSIYTTAILCNQLHVDKCVDKGSSPSLLLGDVT